MNHFVSLKNLSAFQFNKLIDLARQLKKKPAYFKEALKNKYIGLLFEKPSLRTKTAFYIGALKLGAQVIYYSPGEVRLKERERICDVSRTLSRFLDALVVRTFSHRSISEFIKFSSIPIVNALSDFLHPSQALADILTIIELKGSLKNLKVTYIGDGNNVCHSLIYAFSILGGKLCIASPKNHLPKKDVLREALLFSHASGAEIKLLPSLQEAARGADVLYTDVWVSMGKEKEKEARKKAFKNFQINDKILKLARRDCIIMHCLPAHRGEEITDTVLESRNSAVFLQAENRLHTAKAILLYLLKHR